MRALTKEEKIKFAKMYAKTVYEQGIRLEVAYIEILDMWIIRADEVVLIDELSQDEAYRILEEIKCILV